MGDGGSGPRDIGLELGLGFGFELGLGFGLDAEVGDGGPDPSDVGVLADVMDVHTEPPDRDEEETSHPKLNAPVAGLESGLRLGLGLGLE